MSPRPAAGAYAAARPGSARFPARAAALALLGAALGSPSTTSTVGGDAWYYISSRTDRSIAFMQPTITDRKVMAVYFDKSKKVTRIANYGLQDGKVVDFASNTTPTFGSDASLIKGLFVNFNPLGSIIPKS